MKVIYEVKTVPLRASITRKALLTELKKVNALRHQFAATINAMRKARVLGMDSTARHLRETIRNSRQNAYEHLKDQRSILVVIRRDRGLVHEVTKYPDTSYKSVLDELRERVKRGREERRYVHDPIERRTIGHFLNQCLRRKLGKRKTPKDVKAEYIGIEIECITPRGFDLQKLIPFAEFVDVGSDGSIQHNGDESGTELRVCVKRGEVRKVIPPLLKALRDGGARVNQSCGLHVHLDQRNNQDVAGTYQKLVRAQGLLYTVVPPSRRSNSYCRRSRQYNFDHARYGNRYHAINAVAYDRHHTLEVRLFGGTLNSEKIVNWIETLYAIAEGATVLRCPKNFDIAKRYWKLSDENIAWLKARQAQFVGASTTAAESDNEIQPTATEAA